MFPLLQGHAACPGLAYSTAQTFQAKVRIVANNHAACTLES